MEEDNPERTEKNKVASSRRIYPRIYPYME